MLLIVLCNCFLYSKLELFCQLNEVIHSKQLSVTEEVNILILDFCSNFYWLNIERTRRYGGLWPPTSSSSGGDLGALRTPKYSTVQYNTVQYTTLQYITVQYSTVQYSTVQYSTSTVQYSTVQYSTVQYSTVQYSTVQYSTVQYSNSNRRGGWCQGVDHSIFHSVWCQCDRCC